MKRFNVVVPRKYTSNGEEKTKWNNVGTLVYFPAGNGKDEGFALDLHMFPNTTFKVFAQNDRDDRPQQQSRPAPQAEQPDPDSIEYGAEDINPDGIPF